MPVAHNVIRFNGSLPGGEVWSVNPKFGPGSEGLLQDYTNLLAWVENIAVLNTNNVFPSDMRTMMSNAAQLVSIRAEYRDSSGVLAMAAETTLPSPVPGTGSANKPFQTSLVSSLMTGRPGRSYRGRLYWPALAVPLGPNDLRIADGNLAAYTTGIRNFLSAVQSASPVVGGPILSVVSETLSVTTPVTVIECGDVLDVQRRRRDSLVEGRQSANFPT